MSPPQHASKMSTTHVSTETRMFGDLSASLLQESRRATLTNTFPKYNQPLVHSITREILHLDTALETFLPPNKPPSATQNPNGAMCAATIYHLSMWHNQRSLLAYHAHRLNMLKALYWSAGCALPLILNASHIRPNLSPAEVDFLREYDDMVKQFRDEFKEISGGDDLGGISLLVLYQKGLAYLSYARTGICGRHVRYSDATKGPTRAGPRCAVLRYRGHGAWNH